MGHPYVLFGYIGPEVAMPVASVLAGLFGFVLMVGRAPFRLAARAIRSATRGRRSVKSDVRSPSDPAPEAR